MLLKAVKLSITVAALSFVRIIVALVILNKLLLVFIDKKISLRLKVLYAQIGVKDVLVLLLLQLLFYFLPEPLVHESIVRIKLG